MPIMSSFSKSWAYLQSKERECPVTSFLSHQTVNWWKPGRCLVHHLSLGAQFSTQPTVGAQSILGLKGLSQLNPQSLTVSFNVILFLIENIS